MKKPILVILAAGMGSRYGGLKQIDGVGPADEGIIEYSIYDAIRAGFGKVVFVIRKDIEEDFKDKFAGKFNDRIETAYVFQEMDSMLPTGVDGSRREKPWGTAHAMLVAETATDAPFAVINADDYYGMEAFQTMADFLNKECAPDYYSMIGYYLYNTLSDHGHVNRGVADMDADQHLTEVTERLKIERGQNGVSYQGENDERVPLAEDSLVSMNFWGFHPSIFTHTKKLFHQFARDNEDNPRAEFLIPEVVDHLIKSEQARVKVLTSDDKWYGVTYREDKPAVEEAFGKLIDKEVYPSPLWK